MKHKRHHAAAHHSAYGGTKHHSRRHHSSHEYAEREEYAGREMTNEMNAEDGSMIMVHGGEHEMAHLPQQVIMKPYPKVYHYPDEPLMANSDNVRGIDDQMNEDMSGAKRHHSRSKY